MTETVAGHDFITASRVRGVPVFNEAGERIGHVEDLSIGRFPGTLCMRCLPSAASSGFGERFFPIPWSVLTYHPGRGGYIVPIARENLERAPSFTAAELETFGAGQRERVSGYYAPYGL